MSFWLKVCIYSHTRGVKLGLGLGFMQTSQVLPGSHYFFLCTEQFTQTCLHFCTQGSSSSENAKCTFIMYYYICLPIFAHILYFDEAKFSIKLVYFTVSVVRQRNEYEIVTETRPIKTRIHNQLPSKMLICTKK